MALASRLGVGSVTRIGEGLGSAWPQVAHRVVATLMRRGVDHASAEDAVQEAVLRALDRNVPFDEPQDLVPWLTTVAWRVAIDQRRKQRLVDGEVPRSLPTNTDVATEVEDRRAVNAVAACWSQLSGTEREALLADVPCDPRDQLRLRVRRHRARRHLAALIEGLLAAWLWLRRRPRAPVGMVAAMGSVVVAGSWMLHDATEQLPGGVTRDRAHHQVDHNAAFPAPVAAAETLDVPTAPRLSTRAAIDRSDRAADLPRVRQPLPEPLGPGAVWGRPEEPGDHLACVGTTLLGNTCVDSPLQITE